MTKMLASVTGPEEAAIALAAGADIIDLKDPSTGALGALAPATIRETIKAVAGRRPVSAVCGDLPMQPDRIRSAAEEIAETGVSYVKVGFFPSDQAEACAAALAPLAKRAKIIAVLFADLSPDLALIDVFQRHGFNGVMMDTANKSGGRLLDHLPPQYIPGFINLAKASGLMCGLAGSLEAPDVPRLLPFLPDFLGFRGALCGADSRTGQIDLEATRLIRSLIPEEQPSARDGQVDYRLLAARGYSPDSADQSLKTNRIFVRDFVLPVEIGAYSFEHGHTQKVRFDVTADVLRTVSNPEDMRHVLSYDIIMDGIRAIVASGHVQLAEALAEQVAAHVLVDPRVVKVWVRVEKLELGAGGVGVEIERVRSKEQAAAKWPSISDTGKKGSSA
ncbi:MULTISPECIES: (5-formylfuran-3-yl)methyl phosphate synthase [Mesorhizobium]|uniref:4-(hydroxymethyl)-2-furancarboxaldehyde-phosphate synthase n=1 Tax=Mesorhizobium denitrificans TaxID=2294114 RepID=A0A371XCB2_9HYPH|nr:MULTISPECIES: (5-formylfuran-3-yl)methyl phosphate synthase [Mesorhizobium]RFC66860.1 dihydroneopterin aldolase [Mesorhizobium denitrificans]